MARKQGAPESVARNAIAYEFPQAGRPGRFITQADFDRQVELDDFADLMWLLEWVQSTDENPVSRRQMLGMTESGRIQVFAYKFLPVPFDFHNVAEIAPRTISKLRALAKRYVETYIVRHDPIEVPIKATKRLDWFPPKTTWNEPDSPPKEWWVDATTVAQDPSAAFVLRLVDLLERRGRQIGVCAEPSCRRLFLKLKRKQQEYHSAACSQKTRDAKMHQQPDFLEKRRDIYHKRVNRRKGLAATNAE
jgi:hypothetical protein